MVSRAMLLSIWNLEEGDETVNELLSYSSTVSWLKEETSGESIDSSLAVGNNVELVRTGSLSDESPFSAAAQYCSCCSSSVNSKDSRYWCIGCGSCFLSQTVTADHTASAVSTSGKTTPIEEDRDISSNISDCKEHSNDKDCTVEDMMSGLNIERNHFEANIDAMISWPRPSKSKKSTYRRKWGSSSGFYMWQKPSSLKKTTSSSSKSSLGVVANDLPSSDECLSLSLLDLPYELILSILSFLSPADIITCALVCRRLYQVTFDPMLYGREIVLRNSLTLTVFKQAVISLPSSLTLKQCHISSLSIASINEGFAHIGHNLKRLVVDTCNLGTGGIDMLLTAVAQHCPHLTCLELHWVIINGHHLLELVENCCKLQELSLVDVSGVSSQYWQRIATNLTQLNLHSLHVVLCPEVPLCHLFSSQQLLSLKMLTLRQNMNKVQLHDIHLLVDINAPNITSLTLECVEICQEVLNYLGERNISLHLQGIAV